jgi:hypothetical protein
MRVGDKVRIASVIAPLRHRKNKNGIITRIDGYLFYVRPMWCKWKVELYPGEFELLGTRDTRA